jgi:hypothetical protein
MSDQPTKTIEPFVGPIADPDEPLDVKVKGTVDVRAAERRKFRTGTATLSTPNETVQVVGSEPKRRALTILNVSTTDTVYLLSQRSDSAGNGFPILPGTALEMEHHADVYAICPTASAANQVTLAFASEIAE